MQKQIGDVLIVADDNHSDGVSLVAYRLWSDGTRTELGSVKLDYFNDRLAVLVWDGDEQELVNETIIEGAGEWAVPPVSQFEDGQLVEGIDLDNVPAMGRVLSFDPTDNSYRCEVTHRRHPAGDWVWQERTRFEWLTNVTPVEEPADAEPYDVAEAQIASRFGQSRPQQVYEVGQRLLALPHNSPMDARKVMSRVLSFDSRTGIYEVEAIQRTTTVIGWQSVDAVFEVGQRFQVRSAADFEVCEGCAGNPEIDCWQCRPEDPNEPVPCSNCEGRKVVRGRPCSVCGEVA